MGQYFMAVVVNEDFEKNPKDAVVASISPHHYDNFSKLTEHSYAGNHYVNAALNMLYEHNGSRFAWCGDYYEMKDKNGKSMSLYDLCDEFVEAEQKKTSHKTYGIEAPYLYAINLDKKEYVSFPKYNPNRYTVHPLPILCANSNGMGGGDYEGDYEENAGRWAFDHIMLSNVKPTTKEFKSINRIAKFKA